MKKIALLLAFSMVLVLYSACDVAQQTPVSQVELPTPEETVPLSTPVPEIQPSQSVAEGFTITDALGREVSFTKAPQKVVIAGRGRSLIANASYLFPSAAERLYGLENAFQSKNAEKFLPIIDPGIVDKMLLEKDAGAEQIAALQPDVVLMKSYLAEKLGKSIEALGVPVVYFDLETPEVFARDITVLGAVFGDPERAVFINDWYAQHVNKVNEIMKKVPETEKPSVLVLQYTDKGGAVAVNVPPASWLQTLMVESAGGYPLWKDAAEAGGWTVVNFEQIAAWDPDQIFMINYGGNPVETVEKLKTDQNWIALRAVKENHLYAFGGDFYSWDQPDPRWVLGIEWLATKIQPEKSAGIDIQKDIKQFYSDLYRLDAATIEKQVLPMLVGDIE